MMRGIPTRSNEFTIGQIRTIVFPVQLELDEIMKILRFCKDADLISWKGREGFDLNVTYGSISSMSAFFQSVQELGSPKSKLKVDSKQTGIMNFTQPSV